MFKKLLVCLLPLVTLVGCNKNEGPSGEAPLYIANLGSDASIQYYFHADDKEYIPNLQYSSNRKEWKNLEIVREVKTDIVTLSKGETIYFRGDNPNSFSRYPYDYACFYFELANPSVDTKLKIGGNIMSLLSIDNYANKKDIPCDGCFHNLFSDFGCKDDKKLVAGDIDATELLLPATEIKQYAYWDMFVDSAITKAPLNLPATNAAMGMYESMFYRCESLVTAPTINLNNLLESSCRHMFYKCSKLDITKGSGKTKIFTCPDDISELYCVSRMFQNTKQEIEDPKPGEVFYYN